MAKLNQARRRVIGYFREQGYSFSEIGKRMNPPVSKQAIHEICKKCGHKVLDASKLKAYK
jgi:predicted DNA-binding protein YlxM (UPF0122 family)